MSIAPGNPDRLLLALDEHLDHAVRLIIYGRAAVWLGFEKVPPHVGGTRDVDGILSEADVAALHEDLQFWDARDAVHERFKSEGLYITHLFPATLDLVLTKMMRGNDPQDMADAKFMIEHDAISRAQLTEAFTQMSPVQLVELRDAFERAKPIVLGYTNN